MIPQEKSAAVSRGLEEAFGVTACEEIRRLGEGVTSTLVFRIVVRGTPFFLRIATRKGQPARHFACMRAAADAGIAPRVWYTSVEDQLAITDFVEAAPFPVTGALVQMPAALRTLHALAPFPGSPNRINTSCTFLLNGPPVETFVEQFHAARLVPVDEGREIFARYAQMCAVYTCPDAELAPSHNDLKAANILFDGHRVQLVDWEAAFQNDPYADLATVSNSVVTSDADEAIYLREYFGQPPDEYQRARFFLMRQTFHLFHAMGFLLIGSAGKPVDWSEAVPDFHDLHRRLWTGEAGLYDSRMKIAYGRAHWQQLLQNVQQARFGESLRIASDFLGTSRPFPTYA